MITDRIPLAAVLGHPVIHSRSPQLHGYWLRARDLAGHYVPIDVAPADLHSVVEAMPRMGFVGCNVTIPHKEAIMEIADEVSDRAARIGAANTLTFRTDGSVFADNTDGIGFLENLRLNAPGWEASAGPAAIFGAGGAARAVIVALLDSGAPAIRIMNRSGDRAEALRNEFGDRIAVVDWMDSHALLEGAATVTNTTALGMTGHPRFPVPLDGISSEAVATDLIYAPLETDFLRDAAGRGCRTVDGLGMLIHQAVPGFERWFGHRPAVDSAVRSAVLAA